MKFAAGLLTLLMSLGAFAQESRLKLPAEAPVSLLAAYPINYEMRYERGNSGDLESRQPRNFSIGYHRKHYSVLVEYADFTDTTGNSTSSIERRHQDMTVWGRYNALSGKEGGMRGVIYFGAGVGGYEEEVITRFMTDSRSDKTGMKVMGGLSAGLELFILSTSQFGVTVGMEGRALMGSDFDPNPTLGAVLRAGLVVPL
ncbi:hypothetical protein AB1A81_15305 [Bdellovibrio bacteriovorus]|uniref:Organic solvent tolerance protein n=1 Tax=Bdellovibrio bacteriovorus (strain ATCC 15356 / DSM 50701 / NCIMB 9529 / HD100) TaxID=264462 RepID=Q6MI38_BDEBA|nr:hypothetical protein [Bdellovibrio bacteriovorus]CAE78144.1 hypothetical protein predicted by Glimmer/Critica [Bdellovibrio bacteriovorus HD100]